MGRLTFCLLGVATPSDLLRDPRTTAFNIGRRIDLNDFTAQEAAPLARGLGRDDRLAAQLMDRILYWTGGQPYLTQRLCQTVRENLTVLGPAGVDRVCEQLFLGRDARDQDTNIKVVERQMLQRGTDIAGVLSLYQRVRRWQIIRASANLGVSMNDRKATIGRLAPRGSRTTRIAPSRIFCGSQASLGWSRAICGSATESTTASLTTTGSGRTCPSRRSAGGARRSLRGAAVAASIAVPVILLIGLTLQAYRNSRLATANEDAAEGIVFQTHKMLLSLRANKRVAREPIVIAGVRPDWVREALTTTLQKKSDPLFQQLLTITLASYETLSSSQKQTTMYHRVMAAIEHDLGDIAHDLEKFPESEQFYRRAVNDQREACELARKNYSLVYRTFQGGKNRIRLYQLNLNEYYASLIGSSLAAGRGEEAEKAAHVRRAQCAGEPGPPLRIRPCPGSDRAGRRPRGHPPAPARAGRASAAGWPRDPSPGTGGHRGLYGNLGVKE